MQTALYQLRHYITFNVTDPLSEASRGNDAFIQYFSGTGAAGQINYLERKMATGASMTVTVGGVVKTITTDYTYSNTTGELTWVTTPASGNDNIVVSYGAIKRWVYDDNPNEDTTQFPRVSILDVATEREDSGMGIYQNYTSSPGQILTRTVKYIVRDRKNTKRNPGFTYGGQHLKDYSIVQAIAQNIIDYLNGSEFPALWKFWRIKVKRSERIYSEEDTNGIIRHDITAEVTTFDGNR